jgi:putative sigma-54 modulation protein
MREFGVDIELQARHFELTDTIREYVSRKVGRLDRFLPDIKATRVDLDRGVTRSQGEVYTAQVTTWVDATILRAEEINPDLFAAIDLASDKIHRQIEKYKGKRLRRWQGRGAPHEMAVPIEEEPPSTDDGPRIVRRKTFEVYPTTEEEAVDQLELLGHDFFIFVNAETGEMNVLYRRKDGELGLLQPEMA